VPEGNRVNQTQTTLLSKLFNPLKLAVMLCKPKENIEIFCFACRKCVIFMCFVWIAEQTTIVSRYSVNRLAFIPKAKCVYFAVRTESLAKI
jgi:hypothetical protein